MWLCGFCGKELVFVTGEERSDYGLSIGKDTYECRGCRRVFKHTERESWPTQPGALGMDVSHDWGIRKGSSFVDLEPEKFPRRR